MDLDPELAALRPLGGFFVLRTTAGARRPAAALPPTLAQTYATAATAATAASAATAATAAPGTADGVTTADGAARNALTSRVATVADRLRTGEARVAASIAHQGLAARLWSTALACAALYDRLPDLGPRLLRWDGAAPAPDDLWLTEVREAPGDPAGLADTVLHAHLRPLGEALTARYGVAASLLWGNAGSALAGAARELDRWARAHGRTDVADRARLLTDDLFAHPLLRTTGTRATTTRATTTRTTATATATGTGTSTGTAAAFRRRSCCLYYRVPGGGICGDCCFTRPPRSSPGGASG
ncbi:IucA/IucC family C-terminal-domain containing protein [Streptomyces collinus]|uniref:IucA/IucC family C-terminal-domain containing protein n=1 Tax=Streptomyces collinus TaxID=42684 RepID=UPI0029439A5C|nr:IucA/IucC family C-terminal-domain containing protein [Streptomyces collinus]